jgi:hypothetical protein
MADSVGKPITFVVPGQRAPQVSATRGGALAAQSTSSIGGRVKESVRVGVSRGDSGEVRVTAVPGEDVVVLRIAGGPELILHPETARDLIPGPERRQARRRHPRRDRFGRQRGAGARAASMARA